MAKPKYRFQVLHGRHIEGHARVDPDTGKHTLVNKEEYLADKANCQQAIYYKDGPIGNIVETDKNLLKFNSVGSTKFKLISHDDEIVPEVNDGLEMMTAKQLLAYAEGEEIPLPPNADVLKKHELLKHLRKFLVSA